jgi:tryptophanyl-tRNA synthetase
VLAVTVKFDLAYYRRVIEEFGYDPLVVRAINFGLTGWTPEQLSNQWLCHMDGDRFSAAQAAGEQVIATTGFGISGVPHVGTLSQILKAIRLQRSGLPVQIVLGDLDAHNGKAVPLKFTMDLAEQFRSFVLSLGFRDEQPSILRTQFAHPEVNRLAYLLGHYMEDEAFGETEEDLHAFYAHQGKVDAHMSYRRKASLNLMIADFLDLHMSGGFDHVLVFLGIDEHRYVKFGADAIARAGESDWLGQPPTLAALYSGIIKGFFGFPKMSKSFPQSGITVDMSADEIRARIMDGEGPYEGPLDNVVFQMISMASLWPAEEIARSYELCVAGGSAWRNARVRYADHLIEMCARWEG